jgi:Tol biopolymer transport system component
MQRVRDFAQPLLNPKRTGGSLFLAPVLSPDGKTIAFLSRGSEKKGQIFIDLWLGNAITGKRIKRLVESTTNPSFEELRLLYSQGGFSRDGRYFAFTAQTGGRDVLSIIDVRTGHVKQLKDIPLDGVESPSWSPDGKHIVFSGVNGGITDIYTVDTDGHNLRALTKDRYGDIQPQWSPDGKSVTFATDRNSTQLSNLSLGQLQIAVVNVEDGSIQVLPDQKGLNINPVWSPDGRTIAYISDRNGTPNIYMYDLASKQLLQVTDVQGGVSAITEYSPALTWSPGTNRMAFTYYDNNDYTIWALDNPRAYAKTPGQEANPAAPPTQQVAQGVTSAAPAPTVHTADSTADSSHAKSTERSSTYRAPSGARQSSRVAQQEVQNDSTGTTSIAMLLKDPNTGLPDTLTFKEYPYSVRFSPDYIAGANVGVAGGGGYGTVFGGATALVFSDLTGDHQLAVGAGVYGQLSDASLFVGFTNLSHRLQYSTSASRDVYYVNTDAFVTSIPNAVRYTYRYTRFVFQSAAFSSEYPLNRFTRFELGIQANSIGRSVVDQNYDYYDYYIDFNIDKVQSLPTLNFISPIGAFVSDNTLFGLTGPIAGHRMRFSVSPSLGNIRWIQYLGDYRRYDPVIFNTLTFATRFFTQLTVGRDENLLPTYIGQPEFVRGYDKANFYGGYTCDAFLGTSDISGSTCTTAQLVGTRVAVANEELRFPIIRRFDLGALPIGLPPVDGLIFYDAGLAWNAGQKVSLTKPDNYDYTLQRYVMRSWGFGLRVNLFNLAILRWDYAKPLDRDNKKWNWTFSLGPSF